MQVSWFLFLVALLTLSVSAIDPPKNSKKKSRWAMVKDMDKNLTALWNQVQLLSNPVQVHVHGMDNFDTDGQKKPDQDQRGNHVHIHFNLPAYPRNSHEEREDKDMAVTEEYTHAICAMKPMPSTTKHKVLGYVALRQKPSEPLEIKVDLKGFRVPKKQRLSSKGLLHGLHVHQYADFVNGCLSFGGHFNPEGTTHGGLLDSERHAGDWGNVVVNKRGNIQVNMTDARATLFGPNSIIGRGIVIHEKEDDLGKGGTKASLATGDAGGRLNCCVIARTQGGIHW